MLKKIKCFIRDVWASVFFSVVLRKPRAFSSDQIGINFIGYAKAEMGLGEALRSLVRSLQTVKVPLLVRDFDPKIRSNQTNMEMAGFLEPACRYPINCLCINPDMLYRLPTWLRYREWTKQYNVGYWFWELSNFPGSWHYATKLVDEIWVNTEYVAEAMRKSGKPVYKIPFSVAFEQPSEHLTRKRLGLDESVFLFLFSYDVLSSSGRKNPDAVIDAFLEAFPKQENASVGLVIKSVNDSASPDVTTRLLDRIQHDGRITIINKLLTTDEMRGLISCCDCYVSLHRAEGLGLGMAEAMYLGKPVIATAYSGNMEFMNEKNSYPVPYKLIPVDPEDYSNAQGQLWADPDVSAAVRSMRHVFQSPHDAKVIGQSAANYIRQHHSPDVSGRAVLERVRQIEQSGRTEPRSDKVPKSILMLGQRGLQALVSLMTMVFIAKFLSPESQGWYYAFLSLASLYTLADLGLSVALVPYFAVSFAKISLRRPGLLSGPGTAELIKRLRQSVDWYILLAFLYVLILTPFGIWFFGRLPSTQTDWLLPWVAIVLTCAGQLLLLPLMAFIEAAGKVIAITHMRLFQIALSGVACWFLLYENQSLWAAFIVVFSAVVIPFLWLKSQWPELLELVQSGICKNFTFKSTINGVQWRIGVSWLCAYLSSQIYSLILMQLDGPIISGRLALSMAIANMVGVLSLSSMAGKVAFVSHDAARKDISGFKAKFRADMSFYVGIYALGILSVLTAYGLIKDTTYAERVLPLWQIIGLMWFMFVVNLLNLFSSYVRSYLREPFMRVNLIGTLLTLPLAYLGAIYFSSAGIVIVLASVALIVTLPLAIVVWRSEIRQAVEEADRRNDHAF
jgi:glycosyltransferase involved in cell wall biosynthesis